MKLGVCRVCPLLSLNFFAKVRIFLEHSKSFHYLCKEVLFIYEDMIEIGLSYTSLLKVTDADTAIAVGSGDMPVLATPRMLALMENAARECNWIWDSGNGKNNKKNS